MATLAGNEQQLLVPQGLKYTESSTKTSRPFCSAGCLKSALVGVTELLEVLGLGYATSAAYPVFGDNPTMMNTAAIRRSPAVGHRLHCTHCVS
jgi:hypothetical protein